MVRPSFDKAWAASRQIYDVADPASKVAKMIGGYVEKNINNSNSEQKWNNTCAVRMSYILNQSGLIIPAFRGQTVSGADKRQYFFRVNDLIRFLTSKWGKPEIVEFPPSDGGSLAGKKGLILFEVSGWTTRVAMRPCSMAASATTTATSTNPTPLTEPNAPTSGACREEILAWCSGGPRSRHRPRPWLRGRRPAVAPGRSAQLCPELQGHGSGQLHRPGLHERQERRHRRGEQCQRAEGLDILRPGKSPDAVKALVDAYLARDYHNPLVEAEIKGVRFDLLKCLDLYHSKALDRLVKRVVINPGRSYRQDNPAPAKP
jgi:hypothetical protein